ncbi:VWA domain-containing CoxE-like family protein, partial [Aeromonas molluscorum 848]
MMDLALLMEEGEIAGEMALLLAASPKISEFLRRAPTQPGEKTQAAHHELERAA